MTILDKIAITKRDEIQQLKISRPDLLNELPPIPRKRRFLNTLSAPGLSLIAEVKKASPSRGIIRAEFDPISLAKEFESAGAHALSVLTDCSYFQGSPLFIPQIRTKVSLPILRKEFIIDRIQIAESAELGADAILLIQALLTPEKTQELIDIAHYFGLDTLLEVHNHDELTTALSLKNIDFIGINNRNLKTFEIDTHIALGLLETIKKTHPRVPVVAESGYSTGEDLIRLKNEGFSAVLIGEGLATNPEILSHFQHT